MTLQKTLNVSLTARHLERVDALLGESLAKMAQSLADADDPREVAFYQLQPLKFEDLRAIVNAAQKKAKSNKASVSVKVTAEHLAMLLGSTGQHNLAEVRAMAHLPVGVERTARTTAFEEWEAFAQLLQKHDPRKKDHSQDADPGDYPEEE